MKSRFFKVQLAGSALLLGLALAAGCDKTPLAPNRNAALSVTLSNLANVRASLLGAAQNEIFFHLDGTGDPAGHGIYGPFSTAGSTGSVTITIKVPSSPGPQLLSLQLNDAATHQALAVGAVPFDFGTGLAGGLAVDMGSVTRNCYFVDASRNPPNNYQVGSSYNFLTDTLNSPDLLGAGYDIAFTCPLGPYLMEDATSAVPTNRSIAYLGNGELVDFDSVPPASRFFPLSTQAKAALGAPVTTLQAGDVYCVTPKSFPAHIWVQITDPGVMTQTGPSFRFRVNTTVPYYAYEQGPAEGSPGGCSPNY